MIYDVADRNGKKITIVLTEFSLGSNLNHLVIVLVKPKSNPI